MTEALRSLLAALVAGLLVFAFGYSIGTRDPLLLTVLVVLALVVVWIGFEVAQTPHLRRAIRDFRFGDLRLRWPIYLRALAVVEPTAARPTVDQMIDMIKQRLDRAVGEALTVRQIDAIALLMYQSGVRALAMPQFFVDDITNAPGPLVNGRISLAPLNAAGIEMPYARATMVSLALVEVMREVDESPIIQALRPDPLRPSLRG
jgi:hypothetical protein